MVTGKWENSAESKQAITYESPGEGLQFLGMIFCEASKSLSDSMNTGESCITRSEGPFQLMGGREKLGLLAASLKWVWMLTLPQTGTAGGHKNQKHFHC